VFNSLQTLIEFLRNKYDSRKTVYEAQTRLAYMYQKRKGISYANLRNRKRIIDAQKRQSNEISQDFKKYVEKHLKMCFLRDLNPEIVISKEGTFEELESRAIEKELETVKMIKQIVFEKTSNDNKHANNAPVRRVGAELIIYQYCHKIEHIVNRCRFINSNQHRRNFLCNQTNFALNNRNYNTTIRKHHPRENHKILITRLKLYVDIAKR